MKPLVQIPARQRFARARRKEAFRDEAFRFSDAHSGLYISEAFNPERVKILLKFEQETDFTVTLERGGSGSH